MIEKETLRQRVLYPLLRMTGCFFFTVKNYHCHYIQYSFWFWIDTRRSRGDETAFLFFFLPLMSIGVNKGVSFLTFLPPTFYPHSHISNSETRNNWKVRKCLVKRPHPFIVSIDCRRCLGQHLSFIPYFDATVICERSISGSHRNTKINNEGLWLGFKVATLTLMEVVFLYLYMLLFPAKPALFALFLVCVCARI